MKRSWKTSLGGSLAAVGATLFGAPIALKQFDVPLPAEVNKWCILVGLGATVAGVFFTGLFGRDNNVSSDQVASIQNQKPEDPKP